MKITKRTKTLTEAAELKEAEDEVVQPADADGIITDPEDASVADIAKEVQGAVAADTAGTETVNNQAAKEVAAEIKADAKAIEADAAVVGQPFEFNSESRRSTYALNNRLTRALDAALAQATKTKRNKYLKATHSYPNILVEGLPGSGKTSLVNNWARLNGINVVELDSKNDDLKAIIDGYAVQDPDNPWSIGKAGSKSLDGLKKPNSVLFLDEFNRQQNLGIRGSLLTLVQDHTILGANNERVHFDGFLFTIVAINPPSRTDKGATKLIGAEKDRYFLTLHNFDSDPKITREYFKARWGNEGVKDIVEAVKKYDNGVFDEEAVLALEDNLRKENLGLFIINHPDFEYDDEDKSDECDQEGRRLFSQRSLTTLIEMAPEINASPTAGQEMVDALKEELTRDVDGHINVLNFLDSTAQMLIDILDDYPVPTRDDLFRKCPFPEVKALADNNVITDKERQGKPSETNTTNTTDNDSEVDKNDTMWNNRTANDEKADSADWSEDIVNQALGSWF